ncbi:MAG: heat shock protein transcriptional repressor HspR [Solirubrobacteraceae bacterium]
MISVAAELAEMHPQTLRMYESRGLIEPHRSPKGTRLYSHADVERLRRIQEMTMDLGLNLAGVERVLALEEELDRARGRVAVLEDAAMHARAEMKQELESVRRSLRAEVVPVTASTEMVRSADARSPWKVPVRRVR